MSVAINANGPVSVINLTSWLCYLLDDRFMSEPFPARFLLAQTQVTKLDCQQVALEQEKAERSRLLVSLKGNLGRLRQAEDAEQRSGTDVQDLQEQLAAARSAQVHLLATTMVDCIGGPQCRVMLRLK